MTGFRMYQKERLPRTQPRRSRRTHTGTGAGRAPPGAVQVMLVSVRLWEAVALSAVPLPPTGCPCPTAQEHRPVVWVQGLFNGPEPGLLHPCT